MKGKPRNLSDSDWKRIQRANRERRRKKVRKARYSN